MHVSVIVPVYNGASTIRECLESILALDYPGENLELIVVDNASTDATPALLRSFGDRLRVIRETRRGPGAARNAGWRAARGQWLAFTDADCAVHPGWLRHLLQPLENREADAAGGRILARRGAGSVELFGEDVHDHRAAIEQDWPPYLITMNMAISRALLQDQGGFDARWLRSEDSELSFRLAREGRRFAYAPRAVVRHWNRATLRGLSWEGYVHGYWGAALYRAFDTSSFPRTRGPAAPAPPPESSSLPGWQRAWLRRIFRTSKRLGWEVGKWYPPRTLRDAGRL